MDLAAKPIARVEIRFRGRANGVTRHAHIERCPLQAGQRFAHLVTELGVKRKRSRVKGSLDQAHTGKILLRGALMNVFHQAPADRLVLDGGIYRDRADAGDNVSLVQEITADDPPVDLRDDRIETGMRQHPGQEPDRDIGRGKIGRKMVRFGDGLKRFVADRATCFCIFSRAGSKSDIHGFTLINRRVRRSTRLVVADNQLKKDVEALAAASACCWSAV